MIGILCPELSQPGGMSKYSRKEASDQPADPCINLQQNGPRSGDSARAEAALPDGNAASRIITMKSQHRLIRESNRKRMEDVGPPGVMPASRPLWSPERDCSMGRKVLDSASLRQDDRVGYVGAGSPPPVMLACRALPWSPGRGPG
jgi:hypothetical protein